METLVLSQAYEPVARIPWQRAVMLIFQGKVEVVEEYEDRFVRSVTVEIRMPSVIRFVRGLRKGPKGVKFSRENVYLRDNCRCQYCGQKVSRAEATYDHVVPRAQGGRTCWENIVIACVPCNQKKGNRTPQVARMELRSTPVKPKKLSNTLRLTFMFEKGMPMTWAKFMNDVAYWHVELQE
ncbi:HNH endonuclease [Myxococcus sp. K15C18031901]|uniref:HNH endonuclease n=1 Tax=Myxococcus dinghuensis TaxID=2906761 RepID=UPI0020A7D4E5|nr:HNH endonuclease [Myxococcus dinghuensis]MCP3101897.1 HNH endonuclease [Myxococcus dinghuensis]